MDLNNRVAKRLKDIRLKVGLSQKDVAQALFCTRQAYSLKEAGKSRIDLNDIETLADFYQRPIVFFLSDLSR